METVASKKYKKRKKKKNKDNVNNSAEKLSIKIKADFANTLNTAIKPTSPFCMPSENISNADQCCVHAASFEC